MTNMVANNIIQKTADKLLSCVERTIKEKIEAEVEYKSDTAGEIVFTNTSLAVLGKIRADETLISCIEKCTDELKNNDSGIEVNYHPGRPSISIVCKK